MKLIDSNEGFDVYFDVNKQEYIVYKDNVFLIKGFRFGDVKCYLS